MDRQPPTPDHARVACFIPLRVSSSLDSVMYVGLSMHVVSPKVHHLYIPYVGSATSTKAHDISVVPGGRSTHICKKNESSTLNTQPPKPGRHTSAQATQLATSSIAAGYSLRTATLHSHFLPVSPSSKTSPGAHSTLPQPGMHTANLFQNGEIRELSQAPSCRLFLKTAVATLLHTKYLFRTLSGSASS